MVIAHLLAKIGADITGLKSGLSTAERSIQTATQKIGRVGMGLTAGVTMPLIAIGVKGAKVAMDFEEQMAIMGIAARSSGKPISELRKYALKMGADTVFSAGEAAGAMIGLFKAGMSADAVMGDMSGSSGALATAMDLAAASDLSLSDAADTTAVAMATFGLETEAAAAIANSFVQTADASVAEVSDLTQALVSAGPVAASYQWKLEDVNIALGLLSERGLKGAEAGTNLKSMMANLLRPTAKVQETIKNLGIELFDTEGNLKSLPEVVGVLSKALGEGAMITEEYTDEAGKAQTRLVAMTEEMRLENIQTLAGNYGKTAMSILLKENVAGWENMATAVKGAATAEEVADARMNTFKGSLEALGGAVETLYITVMQPIIDDILRPMTDSLADVVSGMADSSPEMLKWGTVAGIVALLAGPLLVIVSKIGTAFLAVGGMVKAGIALLATPLGVAALAIAGFVLAYKTNFLGLRDTLQPVFSDIGKRVKGFVADTSGSFAAIKAALQEGGPQAALEEFKAQWPAIAEAAGTALGDINLNLSLSGEFFDNLRGAASDVFEKLKIGWEGAVGGMAPVIPALQELWAVVGPILLVLGDGVGKILVGAFRLLGDVVSSVLPHIGPILVGVIEIMTASIDTLWGAITGIGIIVKQVLEGDFSGAWETAGGVVSSFVSGFIEIWTLFGDTALELIGGVIDGIVVWFEDMGINLPEIIESMKGDLVGKFDEIKTSITTSVDETISDVVAFFAGLPAKIFAFIVELDKTMLGVVSSITDPLTTAATTMYTIGQNIVQGLVDGINAAREWVKNAVSTLAGLIPQWLRNMLGMGSPSKVAVAIGANFTKSLALGLLEEKGATVDAMSSIALAVESATNLGGAFVIPSIGGGLGMAVPLVPTSAPIGARETHVHISIAIDHLDGGDEEDIELLAWRIASIITERGLTA